jgi:hypothetical protein
MTVFLPPTHTGPTPANLWTTSVAVKAQPLQSTLSVTVVPAAVMVQPKGIIDVEVVVQRELDGKVILVREVNGGGLMTVIGVCEVDVRGLDV